ncbi:hypothetical protein BT96DRAFT_488320 [Gymnopus androsaceus JB14]|uniref:Secreted protein n=1 Tax=Gymnopus androsaceus JB14 TaxID=1447944 RepID=A0A6A4GP54_9AGAR|nr:hypothetical protein BT96DRAFT_488320 [Gymnopus androsaceus JB14]
MLFLIIINMLAGYEMWACVRLWNSEIVFGQHFRSSSVELTSIAFWKYQVRFEAGQRSSFLMKFEP